MKKNKQKTIYYSNEATDDFAGTHIKTKEVPAHYKYISNNKVNKVFTFIAYYLFAFPLVWIFNKIAYNAKYINRKSLRSAKKTGYVLYGNHTIIPGDAFIPSCVTFPKKAYVITHADAVSIPAIKPLVVALGAMPTPKKLETYKNFKIAIKERLKQKQVVTIYPEAHVWPYYTKIRNFPSTSFKFPIENNVPSFCFTTVYKKRKISKKPRLEIIIDGPFFPNTSICLKEQQEDLRNQIYSKMTERSKENEIEYIKYVKTKQ